MIFIGTLGSVERRVVLPLAVAAALGVPFGVWAGAHIDRRLSSECFWLLVIVLILATGVLTLIW